MIFDEKTLYELLPAIYRIRDAEQGEPLKALMKVISEQAGVLEENLAQLYDDQFAETAASWVLPYIGDLIGLSGLASSDVPVLSSRAEVAHTIGYRRRKGTAGMLEQLAHDVTGWPAHAVEFFELIAATQYMNHLRPENQAFLSVRGANRLEDLDGAFERATEIGDPDLTHTVDVRRIAKGHGKYNIPNIGIFLWRLRAMALTRSPVVPAAPGELRRFRFNPLGLDAPLFNLQKTEVGAAHLAEPINVPDRIRRRVLARALDHYYGKGKSLLLEVEDSPEPEVILSSRLVVCDLTDWINLPTTNIAIDPVLGRIAFPQDQTKTVLASFHYGFSDNMGGGEYSRFTTSPLGVVVPVVTTIAAALSQVVDKGTVEIANSGRYAETLTIDATGKSIEIRAADKRRPTVILGGDLHISGGKDDEVVLDGLLIAGGSLQVSGGLGRLKLRDCTLVPVANVASLVVASPDTHVEIERCILGGIRTDVDADVTIADSIVDATAEALPAYAGTAGFGAPLRITNSTVIGIVRTTTMHLASNTIFLSASVVAERRQDGCVRFSYVSRGARLPVRYHCQPETDDSLIRPQFTSTHFRDPGYCQLSAFCPAEIRSGADDESSMGAFHDLYEPQREARLRTTIEEYLRFGLEAGVFFVT